VTVYVPAEPLQSSVEVWLGPSTILVKFSAQVRPAGEADDARLTVPVKPLRGATVMVEDPNVPAVVVMATGLGAMEKSGAATLLPNVAVWAVSGTGIGVPFAIVTHTPPLTLVFEQPVWKPRFVPEVVPVML
jgi:hypothetical protein